MSRYDKYSDSALDVLVKTQDIALRGAVGETGYRDLAEALMLFDLPDIIAIAKSNNAVVDVELIKSLNERIQSSAPREVDGPVKISGEFRSILERAEALAGDAKVEPSHLIRAAWPTIKGELAPFFRLEAAPALAIPADEIALPEMGPRAESAEAIAALLRFGDELTGPDADFPVFGREDELDALSSVLMRYWKPNPLIVGESGVGKTALVQGLAMRIKSGNVPARLRNARIFEVRVSELLAGTAMHGALEENVNQLVEAAEGLDDVYLFIDEIHQVVPAFANNPISETLKPALSSGRIRCIGATTSADYSRYLEKDGALLRRFQTVLVKEPDEATIGRIVAGVAPRLERHFGVSIPETVRSRSVEVARRYLPMRRFPDKALDVLDRASARAAFRGEAELAERHLLEAVKDIANVVVEPGLDEASGLAGLEAAIGRDVLRQEAAIKAVADAVRVARMRLDPRKDRPSGAFLLTGPTGVGKTAFAERLAKALSGRDDALFRIDMSEFSDGHTASRLLGAPPGYIGYDDAPLLSKAVDACAGGVLLLDEFEKAHAQVHRIFLQILDAGRATDSTGRTLSFSGLTIVATCNVGGDAGPALGFLAGTEAAAIAASGKVPTAALRRAFPIELLNRFDAIVPFRALDRDDARAILTGAVVRDANDNLRREYGVELSLTDGAVELLLAEGYSVELGVRDLQRAFRRLVAVPLASMISGLAGRGVLRVDAADGAASISPA
ncbi:MAG TPA: ATP-dependent Clp protease ATP-binding subunit [Spirochaetia bacterium]|nr:ATP-dependent Clp protease ATP-binding subunit [Spirochaetaceae bacterium]HPE89137.1 ATP-dependent Clp protease ATP-binding subunit [Spirochaetales bacterium]HRW23468.1 ATP-dependent Clp protease ATP-binding subunit [Spirochaetia bacterium]